MAQGEREAARVLAANERFYAAFRAGDAAAIEALTATTALVACIHPGGPALVGRAAALESWRAILGGSGRPAIHCEGAVAHLLGDAAFVTCYERIGDDWLVATNVFALEAGEWRLAHHHAGPTAIVPRRAPGPATIH